MDDNNIIKNLSKEFEDYVTPLSQLADIEVIPFGIKSLDGITGKGGVPLGMITEIYGSESSGKTSLTLKLISEAQKKGLRCAFIDTELSITKELATIAGVDMDKLLIARPKTGEEAFQVAEEFVNKGIKLVVVDSVSSLVPADELEAEYSQQSIGLQARLMSKGIRKILGPAMTNKAAIVFINQVREDINKMGFGPKKTTSGGRALRFYAAMRLEVARKAWKENTQGKVGMTVIVKMIKNKMYRPQLETEFDFYFDRGFDVGGDLLNSMVNNGKAKLVGRTYYIGNEAIGTKDKAIEYILNEQRTKEVQKDSKKEN